MTEEIELVSFALDRRSFLRRAAVGGAGSRAAVRRACRRCSPRAGARRSSAASGRRRRPPATTDLGELDVPALVDQERGVRGRVHRRHERLLQGGGLLEGHAALRRPERAAGRGGRRRARRSSCISAPDITSVGDQQRRRAHRSIGAQYQKNPFCVMSLGDEPDQDARGHDRQEDRRAGHQRGGVDRVPQGQQHRPVEDQQGAGAVRPDAAGQAARSTAGSRSSPTSRTC